MTKKDRIKALKYLYKEMKRMHLAQDIDSCETCPFNFLHEKSFVQCSVTRKALEEVINDLEREEK